jgi:hypothetical protein
VLLIPVFYRALPFERSVDEISNIAATLKKIPGLNVLSA